MEWKYNLVYYGSKLRESIHCYEPESVESCRTTLNVLKNCYDKIHKIVTTDEWWDIEDYYTTLESDIDILNEENDIKRENRLLTVGYDGYNPALECVNNNLKIFYDLCDYYRIFIPA
jgi:hypothetical protein